MSESPRAQAMNACIADDAERAVTALRKVREEARESYEAICTEIDALEAAIHEKANELQQTVVAHSTRTQSLIETLRLQAGTFGSAA